jgi:hypothetical protein
VHVNCHACHLGVGLHDEVALISYEFGLNSLRHGILLFQYFIASLVVKSNQQGILWSTVKYGFQVHKRDEYNTLTTKRDYTVQ